MMETEEIETLRDYDIPEYSLTVCHYHPPSSAGDLSNSGRDKDSLNQFLPRPMSGQRQRHDADRPSFLEFSLVRKAENSRFAALNINPNNRRATNGIVFPALEFREHSDSVLHVVRPNLSAAKDRGPKYLRLQRVRKTPLDRTQFLCALKPCAPTFLPTHKT